MAKSVISYDKDLPEIPGRCPWEPPTSFLVKEESSPTGWIEKTDRGRRPSHLLLIKKLRAVVDKWRTDGYQRLERDFASNKLFYEIPLIPPEWLGTWSQKVILRGESTEPDPSGNLFLTNVQQLYETRQQGWTPKNAINALLGPNLLRVRPHERRDDHLRLIPGQHVAEWRRPHASDFRPDQRGAG